jgi:hypothetical protein
MFLRRGIATLAFTLLGFGAGAAFTSQASAQNAPMTPHVRGERQSAQDITHVERRLKRIIASLNRDQRDYGGHRANAINLLNQADAQLEAALAFDATTPH